MAHSAGMSAASISSLLSSGLASTQRGVSIVAVDAPAAQPCTATHLAAGVTALQGATGSWATPAGAQLGRIVYCNDSFAAMCGRSSKDLVGSSFEVVIGPDTDPEQVGRLREAIYTQQSDNVQLLCYRSNGTTFWNSISIGPISTTDPSSLGCASSGGGGGLPQQQQQQQQRFFLALHHDVSALVLDQDGFRLRDLALHSCSEGITLVDPNLPEMPIVYVNDAFLEMTGYTREEVLGRNCRFLQGPGTDGAALSRLRKALLQHHKCTVQLLNYRKDGASFWNLLSVTPVFDSSGRLTSYIGVQSDISELVARKEEEQRAVEAKVAAETAMEAKSMFLANMSHEIRTPLNGMMAMAQLLLSSVLTPEQRDLAETILESSTSLLGILGDILDFSKLDQGEVQLQRRPFCLRGTIEACIEMVTGDALKKGLQVAYLLQDEELAGGRLLMGDPVRVRQLLANLLSNAVKFTEHGDVVVAVSVEAPGFGRAKREAVEQKQAAKQAAKPNDGSANGAWTAPVAASSASASSTSSAADVGHKWHGSGVGMRSPCSVCGTASSSLSSLLPAADSGTTANNTAGAAAGATAPDTYSRRDSGSCDCTGAVGSGGAGGIAMLRSTLSSSTDRAATAATPSSDNAHSSSENALDEGADAEEQLGLDSSRTAATAGMSSTMGAGTVGSVAAGSDARLPAMRLPEVHVAVSDSGIGISATQAAKLFQCFKQGAETMSRRYGGTGLGLAICRQLTELMGGEIWVESELGRGSTFHFTIPAQWAAPHTPPSPEQRGMSMAASDRRWVTATSLSPSPTPTPFSILGGTEDSVSGLDSDVASVSYGRSDLTALAGAGSMSGSTTDTASASAIAGSMQPLPSEVSVARSAPLLLPNGGGAQQQQQQQQIRVFPSHGFVSPAPASTCSELSDGGTGPTSGSGPNPEDFSSLQGKRVLVDVVHGPTAMQVVQSCRLLGLHAERGDIRTARSTAAGGGSSSSSSVGTATSGSSASCAASSGSGSSGGAAGHGPSSGPPSVGSVASSASALVSGQASSPYDLAVVGVEHAVDAIRHAWKGRPLVVLGNKSALPGNLHPLAVFVPLPVRHARLAAALLKSMVLLKWLPNGAAPRLSDDTISQHVIQDFKNWRMRQASDMDFTRRTSLDNSALCRRNTPPVLSTAQQQQVQQAKQQAQAQATQQVQEQLAQGQISWCGEASSPGTLGTAVAGGSVLARMGNGLKASTPFPEPIPEHSAVVEGGRAQAPGPTMWTQAPVPASWAPSLLSYSQQQRQRQQQQALEAAEQAHRAQVAAASKPSLRILIAEDNKVNQKVVLKVLQRICASECQPDVVENGLQVLRALETKRYDLILMDIHMPEMDGLEASRRICQRFPRPEDRPRIVALSADTMQTLHDRCREAGIEEFILKPFRVEDLKRVMSVCSHVVSSRREEMARAIASNGVGATNQGNAPLLAM